MLDPETYTIETVLPTEAAASESARPPLTMRRLPARASSRARDRLNGTARRVELYRDIDVTTCKRWLIDDMLGEGELSVWYGPPGSGKSVLVGDAACHVAAGLAWHGRPVERGAVLYVAAERGALVKRRLAAWRKHHGLSDIPLAVVQGGFDLCTAHGDTDDLVATVQAVEETTGERCRWIIIDTKAQVMGGGDENSATDVVRLVDNLSHLQRVTGAHVTIVDHTPHDAPHRMRGHGALLGAADATFRVAKGERVRTMKVDKANDGPDDVGTAFTLASIDLATDPRTGKVTTAPIVVQEEPDKGGQAGHSGMSGPKLSPAAALALRALHDTIADIGRPAPPSTVIPRDARIVTAREWRDACDRASIEGSDKPDARRKRFTRSADELQQKRFIGVHNGVVWTARGAER